MRTNIAFVSGRWVLEIWDADQIVAMGQQVVGDDVRASLRDVEALVNKAYQLGVRDGKVSEKKRKVRAEL